MPDFSIAVALVLLGAMVLLWMVVRPVFAAVAVASFAFVSPTALPVLLGAGRLSFRYVDIFSGILACIVLMRLAARRDTHGVQELGAFYVPLMPFLLYIGISLANVDFFQPHSLTASLASYLRLIATASLAPLVYLSIQDKNDLGIFHKLLICCFLISVVASAVEGRSTLRVDDAQWSSARGSGSFLSVNTLGLVSGLLVVYALIKGDGKSRCPLPDHLSLVWSHGAFLRQICQFYSGYCRGQRSLPERYAGQQRQNFRGGQMGGDWISHADRCGFGNMDLETERCGGLFPHP